MYLIDTQVTSCLPDMFVRLVHSPFRAPFPTSMSFYWHLSLSQRVRVPGKYKPTIWGTIFDALSCQARISISISNSQVDFPCFHHLCKLVIRRKFPENEPNLFIERMNHFQLWRLIIWFFLSTTKSVTLNLCYWPE